MIIKASYDKKPCFLNTDYILDVFEDDGKYKAYTLDVERDGYEIEPEEFKKWISKTNED